MLNQSFDQDYRLTSKSVSGINDLSYGYTPRNNINSIVDSFDSSFDQSFSYDNLARLTDATGAYGVQSYGFDAIGNRLSKTQDSVTETYQYEANSHRLSSVGLTNLSFDPIGNTLTKGELSFSYNQMGRMVTASKTDMSASYQYNAQGERVRKTVNSETTLYHYDQAGQLIAQTDGQGAIIQEYIYLDGMRLATMSKAKLATVTLDEEQASLNGSWSAVSNGALHNSDGQIVSKLNKRGSNASSATWTTNLASGTYEVYAKWFDNRKHATNVNYQIAHANGTASVIKSHKTNGGSWQLLGTYDFNGAATISLNNDTDGKVVADAIQLVPIDSPVQTYYVHTDHLGSPIALTDQAGAVQWKGSYDPYGKVTVELDNLSQELRFPGQILDAETGMHQNYFRDYDPEIGRYLQSDPIGLNGGINTYGYVGANPVNFIDPKGLSQCPYGRMVAAPGNESQFPAIYMCTDDGKKPSNDELCMTAECVADVSYYIPPDTRTLEQCEADQCVWTCNVASSVGTLGLNKAVGWGLKGTLGFMGVKKGFCEWKCDE